MIEQTNEHAKEQMNERAIRKKRMAEQTNKQTSERA